MNKISDNQGTFGSDPISTKMSDALARASAKGSDALFVQLIESQVSLRDRFAMAAMQGDWTRKNGIWASSTVGAEGDLMAARYYYQMADAMLKAREVKS